MRTYELYYSGPRERVSKLDEPSVEHLYADFIQTLHSSDYEIKKCSLKYKPEDWVEIEVVGEKRDT